jgi:hypothetical protein
MLENLKDDRNKFYTEQSYILGKTLFCIRQTHYRFPRKSAHVSSVLNTSLQGPKRIATDVSTPHVRAPTMLLLLNKGN